MKNRIVRWWYKIRYGIQVDFDHSIMPAFGEGQFVSVFKKGPFLDIVATKRMNQVPTGTIRLIPAQYNHGVMVEYIPPDGNVRWRMNCDYDAFYKMGSPLGESAA